MMRQNVEQIINVAGIAQTDAQKCSDMFMKCQYLDDVICYEL